MLLYCYYNNKKCGQIVIFVVYLVHIQCLLGIVMVHSNAYNFVNTPELPGTSPLVPQRDIALDLTRDPEKDQ